MNLWQNKFDKCGKILIGIVYIIPTGGSVVLTDHICKIIINGGDFGGYFGMNSLISKAISYMVM